MPRCQVNCPLYVSHRSIISSGNNGQKRSLIKSLRSFLSAPFDHVPSSIWFIWKLIGNIFIDAQLFLGFDTHKSPDKRRREFLCDYFWAKINKIFHTIHSPSTIFSWRLLQSTFPWNGPLGGGSKWGKLETRYHCEFRYLYSDCELSPRNVHRGVSLMENA